MALSEDFSAPSRQYRHVQHGRSGSQVRHANQGYPIRQVQQIRRKPKKKSPSLLTSIMLGLGLTVGALVGASMLTVATSVKSPTDVKFETALLSSTAPQGVAAKGSDRDLDVSKFSRLPGSASSSPKASRLNGAETAALAARRPDSSAVMQTMQAAMISAARDEEVGRQFAALENVHPGDAAIKAALGPALASFVSVAPKGDENAPLPEMIQGVQPANKIADLKDMRPVQMAAIGDDSSSDDADDSMGMVAEDDIPVPTPAPAQSQMLAAAPAAPSDQELPRSGPLPGMRPGTALASAGTDSKPNALAAIAAVAPQRGGKADDDSDNKPTALAFARPDNPMRDDAPARVAPSAPNWPGIGTKVAIFDMTAGTVHLPDGSTLEAHSGIGNMRDNPSFAHVKMRGPTPPGTYKLSMRESLFHGVAAIRLTPIDGKAPLGRTGLLAHSYLLRSRLGDSHGCVAFAQYDKFLAAFRRGEINYMVIVPKWDGKRPGRGTNNGFFAKLFGDNSA